MTQQHGNVAVGSTHPGSAACKNAQTPASKDAPAPTSEARAGDAISFSNVSFTYDGSTPVLNNISFSVEPGTFLCIAGSNGSGKSTIAKHIDALVTPTSGSVHVLGHDTRNAASAFAVRSNVGLVFQNPDDQLVASIVEDDVAFGPENMGLPRDAIRTRVSESLAAVGLAGFERRQTHGLSGGQKQRVAIAGALAMHPQILVFDEATAMLDPRGRYEIASCVKQLHEQGMTVVMITHFMEEAAAADRVIALDSGMICMDGSPASVLTQSSELARLRLEAPIATRLANALRARGVSIPACTTMPDLEAKLCALHSSK